jgi:hypothetical protein
MAAAVIFMLFGIAGTIGFFFLNIITGVVCGVVVLVILTSVQSTYIIIVIS